MSSICDWSGVASRFIVGVYVLLHSESTLILRSLTLTRKFRKVKEIFDFLDKEDTSKRDVTSERW